MGTEKKMSSKNKTPNFEVEFYPGFSYYFLPGDRILVKDNDKVLVGDILTKERFDSAEASKTQDIVQGLPKVEELFEARKPKDAAILSEINGIVDIQNYNYLWKVVITNDTGEKKEYKVPK